MTDNTENRSTGKKKSSPLTTLLIIGAVIFLTALDEIGEDLPFFLIGLAAVGVIIYFAVKAGKQAQQRTHSHDRIDHRRDLEINPETGKPSSVPVHRTVSHSPQEHWKQQLDGLLANGTIDRAEYQALLRHKF